MTIRRSLQLFILILIIATGCNTTSSNKTRLVGVLGDSAMVVSAHPIATEVGLYILSTGGNAFDATVAIQLALAVVYPRAGNIGGGGFSVIRNADGTIDALDFREKAPLLATETMFQDEAGNVITDLSTRGHLGAGVPGSIAGMWQLHQKYGALPWADLVQPSINIASQGFRITQNEAEALNEKQEDFKLANHYKPWVIKESGWRNGDFVSQPQLAATLSYIRDKGRDGFYSGVVAEQIVKEMSMGNGLISLEDLVNYEAIWRAPLTGIYKGHKVISMPPPSSGGVALLQLIQGAETYNIGQYPHNSTKAVHVMAELERRVFADRSVYLGDPDFFDVPVAGLLDSAYNAKRFENIDLTIKTNSSTIKGGEVPYESTETTHFSIVDKYGNAVSTTTTLNLNYGCKIWVKDAGFVLNNEMDDFSAKPGTPNFFGLVGGKANAIAPSKRMLSSMTPTIVEKDGQLKMVLGTPGGSTIITSVFQTLLNVVDYDMTMQEAVRAKKVHHQWLPDQIKAENDALDQETIDGLKAMGHELNFVDKIGRNDCILIREDGKLEGGADPRGDDAAMGY
ncbi:MAG: gamma-glutamyltranspeptidase/glutathione hydrolase [Marinoscillum sp.]|jgi:gamma-glutamyltranspeptidase/glutathione hydrolase